MIKYTIFCDIDGVLLKQVGELGDFTSIVKDINCVPTEKAAESIMKWHIEGHRIILTTGRPECMRKLTEDQLQRHGFLYDQLVMGVGSGPRLLINDTDPRHPNLVKASAIVLERNVGIANITLNL